AEAEQVLARAQPPGRRDQALTACLQALTGQRDPALGPAADRALAASGPGDGPVVAAARIGRSVLAWDHGRVGDGLDLLRDAARTGPGVSPDTRQPQPLLALAAALIDLRELGAATGILRTVERCGLPGGPARAALSLLQARRLLAGGRLAEAATEGQAALALAGQLGAHGYRAAAHHVLSLVELRGGDLDAAARHLAARPVTGPQFADIYVRPEAALAEAVVAEARDGPGAALDLLQPVVAGLADRPGLLLGDPGLTAWLTRTALAAGQVGLAARAARVARALADTNPGYPGLAAAAAHGQGLARRDPAALAEAAAQHPDPWARASAAEDLGVLQGRQGRRDDAIGRLKEALGGYTQTGARRDQARIRRRLRRLGVRGRHWSTPPARPVTGWPSLTATEQAVAALVAEGLNNGQVAGRMYISPHTVAHHLRQAFRKLGIASRVELTRIVLEQRADGA
ncbi:MAG TPA: helix-turn-helix transcriptional regulator, partial [Streptosporangiaceae bacterium]